MEFIITQEQMRMRKQAIAEGFGLEAEDVRCYHCKKWGYNCGKVMNSMGESKCVRRTGRDSKTASYQWCKHFDYVGNGK